jgi:hypothetical protein
LIEHEPHEPIADCDCRECAIAERNRLRQEVTMLRQEYAADTAEIAKLNAMRDKLLAALTEIAELDILKYHHAYAIAKGAIEEIEALK